MKIDIISGFLGAGKTTFIKRLLETKLKDEKVVLIENEYGEISVDTDLLQDSKIEIKELSQGCICCSLVGDFSKSLKEIVEKFNPDRLLIEPSGVGKLSDIIKAVSSVGMADAINSLVCMVDAKKAKMYDKNFGEFFVDQIENASTVILSRTDISKEDTVETAVEIIRKHNKNCVIITTPIATLSDEDLLKAYEGFDVKLLDDELLHYHHDDDDDDECDDPNCSCHEHHHHHHHHDEDECDDPECECHHHHDDDDDDEEEHEHEHHHHHHHDEDECDDPECECHHHHDHDHEHHHHHHADEVFTSIGIETVKKYDLNTLKETLNKLAAGEYGVVVRAKGIIRDLNDNWYVFNLTPEEVEVEPYKAIHMGKIVVIGSKIDEETIKQLF